MKVISFSMKKEEKGVDRIKNKKKKMLFYPTKTNFQFEKRRSDILLKLRLYIMLFGYKTYFHI